MARRGDVLGFIKSHSLVPVDSAKAAFVFERSKIKATCQRILEYWERRNASGWDDPIEPAAA